jgi:hypothetical protein
MEGLDALRLHGKTITLQFWVKSTLTGLYSVAFGNNYDASSYKYVSTYTVNAANTWEQKSVTLEMTPAIVSNFAKDNTQGFFVAFGIAANVNGSRITSSLNQWLGPTSGALIASTANRTDFLTAGNSIRIAQVKLSIGSGISDFSFAGRTYSDELSLCQRYYETQSTSVFFIGLSNVYSASGTFAGRTLLNVPWIGYNTTKRANPTVTATVTTIANNFSDFNINYTSGNTQARLDSRTNGYALTIALASGFGNVSGLGASAATTLELGPWTADAEL